MIWQTITIPTVDLVRALARITAMGGTVTHCRPTPDTRVVTFYSSSRQTADAASLV